MDKQECFNEDATILALLANGSECTFRLLYNKHNDRIYKLAMRYLKSSVLAQEVVQDVFLKLWIQRQTIKIGTPIEGWLITVSKNDIFDKLRRIAIEWKAINQLKFTQETMDDSMQCKFREIEYGILVDKALNTLSNKQLMVYKLARQEHLSYVQIARHLDISPLTVKTHMSRALGHVRCFLRGHIEQ
jgi:RNA polymerase sigma-70 factor (family 1)